MKAFTLEAELKLDSSGFQSSLGSIEGTLNSQQSLSGFSAWGTTIGNLAASAFQKTFSAGVQFAKDVVNKTMNFESAMSAVESVTSASEDQMDAIKTKARELGGSTVYTAEEVAEAMFYMGQAGWDTEQILAGIAPVMDLAAASGDDLSRVSDIVTDSLTAFGMTADKTGHFVDVLAQTARNSNTNVTMVGEAFKYLAPLAGTLGYSIDDVGTALGLLANNGIKSSMAGTSLRTILSTLIGPSDAAAEAMADLGISLTDSNGRVKSFAEVMSDFRRAYDESGFDLAGKSLDEIAAKTEELAQVREEARTKFEAGAMDEESYASVLNETSQQLADFVGTNANFLKDLTDIGGLRGISALLAIMKSTDEDYNGLSQSIEESTGAAAEMAAVQRDNLKGDLTLLNSAVDDLQLTMGEQINDPLRKIVQNATDVVTSLNTYMTAGQGTLDADAMSRIMDRYDAWKNTSVLQLVAKNNRITELYRAVADELEAIGASDEEIQGVVDKMINAGSASQLLDVIQSLQDAKTKTDELKTAADTAAGDYDLNFNINVNGGLPDPMGVFSKNGSYDGQHAIGSAYVPRDNYVALLHRGEQVLTATQARQREGGGGQLNERSIRSIVRSAMLDLTMQLNDETVGRVVGDSATTRVNNNIGQINRRHRYGYGG